MTKMSFTIKNVSLDWLSTNQYIIIIYLQYICCNTNLFYIVSVNDEVRCKEIGV